MNIYFVIVGLAVSTLLQIAFLPKAIAPLFSPDLVLILVASWSLLRGAREGIVWGGIGGLFLGIFSQLPLGTHILLLTFLASLISLVQPSIYRSNLLFPLVVVFLASLLYNLGLVLIGWLTFGANMTLAMRFELLISVIFPQALGNTFLTLLIYPLLRAVHTATSRARLGW
ncbi:MAG: rod shape-determining protein MreD [Chloroflexi bacterium]|nr:rod shape-determining protein MreD [Chloroflexota bacterium]